MKKALKLLKYCLLIILFSCNENKKSVENKTLEEFENEFVTDLKIEMKAPQVYDTLSSYESIKLITYESEGRKLQALLDTQNIQKGQKRPVLVFFHGGFALGIEDVLILKPFIEKGFIVLAPSYRGENGNNGYFELLLGEVNDAANAIKWIAKQDYVDTTQIYTFGHSIGGAISLNLSLKKNLPIKLSGSSAGLYDKGAISMWSADKMVPFDTLNNYEILARLPIYKLSLMQRNHLMYIGDDDNYKEYNDLYNELYPNKSKLEIIKVKGDHFSSFSVALTSFLNKIQHSH